LENIALKMLEKDPAKRYQSMKEVVEDIERYESGGKLNAPNYNARRIARKVRKHPKLTAAGVALTLALAVGGVGWHRYSRTLEYLVNRVPAVATNYEEMNDFSGRLMRRVCKRKLDNLVRKVPSNLFPSGIERVSSEWDTTEGKYWFSGSWPKMLWIAHEETGKDHYKKSAEQWTRNIIGKVREGHERGSLFFDSYVKGYEITNNEEFKVRALEAAKEISSLYDEERGFVRMDDAKKRANILNVDTMRTAVPLLLWAGNNASTESERERLEGIVLSHADSVAKYSVREDGSTIHLAGVDPKTRKIGTVFTWDGYKGGGSNFCFSRGHANAMLGFVSVYEDSGEERFLKVAERLADFYIANVPKKTSRALVEVERGGQRVEEETFSSIAFVPFYDFRDPGIKERPELVPKDSSAASTAALSLYRLSKSHPDKEKARVYRDVAYKTLRSLQKNCFIADEDHGALLGHATGNANRDAYVNGSFIQGDADFFSLLAELK